MKKKNLFKKVALGLAIVVGLTAVPFAPENKAKAETFTEQVVGNTDLSSAWWAAHSDSWKVEKGQSLVVTFVNDNPYNGGTGTYVTWNNYSVVLSNTAFGAEGYAEYFVQRADHYGWGNKWNANTLRSWIEWDFDKDFEEDLADCHGAIYDGATITLVVSRDEKNEVNVTAYAINTITVDGGPVEKRFYNAQSMTLEDTDELFAHLTIDGACLTIKDVKYYDGVVVGAPNMSSGFEFAFAPTYELADGETVQYKMKNYIGGANWDSVRTIFADKTRTDAEGRTLYLVMRADNFIENGSCKGADGWTTNVGGTACDFNWDTFRTNCSGADATVTASREGARVTYRLDIKGLDGTEYYNQLQFDLPSATDPCYVWTTTTWSYFILDVGIAPTPSAGDDVELVEGATAQITQPTDKVTNFATITYKSSDDSVAKVDATGKITAVSKGEATITVTYTNGTSVKSDTCKVTVLRPMESVVATPESIRIHKGNTTESAIATVITPEGTTDVPTITYKSADETIATVDETGKVTGVKAGTTTITVTATAGENVQTDTVAVEVFVNPTSVTIDETLTIEKGKTATLTKDVLPTDTTEEYTVEYTSDKEAVATVDATGKVTAVAAGTATITATLYDGNHNIIDTAECTVTVVVPMTGISVEKTEVELFVEETSDIKVTVAPTDTTDKPVITYASSDAKVATVDANGKITAVGKGTATITVTATAGENVKTATVAVTVKLLATDIEIDETKAILTGESATLTTTVLPDGAEENYTVEYSTSDDKIATVDKDGKITAVAAGNVTVIATLKIDGEVVATAECKVTVQDEAVPMTGITVTDAEVALKKGETSSIKTTVAPADTTDNPTFTYATSDDKVATVDKDGKITAVGAGTATITVTATAGENVKTATVKVTVTVPMTGVTAEIDKDAIYVGGDAATITATLVPSDTTDKAEITYTTSDEKIATVDKDGKVTAVGAGTATITVKAGEFTTTVKVKVLVNAEEITIDEKLDLVKGLSKALTVKVLPEVITEAYTVEYKSSDEKVATVDKDGKVTAVAAGKADITATLMVDGKAVDTAVCAVVVTVPQTGVTAEIDKDVLYIGGAAGEITAVVVPEDTTDEVEITYTTSDDKVATVDKDGKVTAVAVGKATITVKAGEFTATVEVEVKEPVIDSEVEKAEDVPEMNVTIDKEEVEEMLGLTEEEKEAVLNGAEATLKIEVDNADKTVAKEDKELIEKAVEKVLAEKQEVGKMLYLEIDAFKVVGDDKTPLSELGKPVEIAFTIPDEWIPAEGVEREFKAFRIHDGVAEELEGKYDAEKKTFTVSTDKFSTYALAYVDVVEEDVPQTGDYTGWMVALAGLALSAAAFVALKRKKTVTE